MNISAAKPPISESIALAYTIAAVVNGVLVIAKELNDGLHDVMVNLTGHHWSTQAVVLLVLLVGIAVISHAAGLPQRVGLTAAKAPWWIVISTFVSFTLIALFYIFHYAGSIQ